MKNVSFEEYESINSLDWDNPQKNIVFGNFIALNLRLSHH